jgi:hypothetical protein
MIALPETVALPLKMDEHSTICVSGTRVTLDTVIACYQQGHTAPAEVLLEQYRHTVCIAGAIRSQIDGKTYRQAALDIGRNPRTFSKYMKRAARMLSAAYA